MNPDPDSQPFSESHLNSPEYRDRLMRKLNTLIAVLEVAGAKVRRSMDGPGADLQKLGRIKKNLQDTLEVCMRARTALEHRGQISGALANDLSKVSPDLAQSARALHAAGAMTTPKVPTRPGEWTSAAEAARLAAQPRIQPEEVWACDLELLARQLQA
ncbi:MAG TPA: hypothetical protein VM509_11635 [Planctomycetota bacterium]|nr:hypothetical protein [Planctomycetota bacterium]